MTLNKSQIFIKYLEIVIKLINFIQSRHKFKILYILKRNLLTFNSKVIFINERKNWALTWIGLHLTENLKKLKLINAEVASPILARNKILHWGAIAYLIKIGLPYLDKSKKNFNIVNWYHLEKNDKRIKIIQLLNKKVDFIITYSLITKKILIEILK